MSVDVDALLAMTVEKGIPLEKLINSIEQTVTESYSELPEAMSGGRAVLNRQSGDILIQVPQFDAEGIYSGTITDMPQDFEAKIKSIVRKVLKEKMRAMNDAGIVAEFTGSVGDIISGIVQQGRDQSIIYVDLGKVEGKIPQHEQVPHERYTHGDRIKAYVVDVRQGEKGPEVTLSRTHPMFVKMLFTLEVPELKDRVVEIVGVSREPGQRSKVSVRSHRVGVSPKGALIGPLGARSKAVMDELNGEKIDIVDFSEDPATYVASSLAPARVTSVEIVDLEAKSAKVIVPDFQLSLAIGKDGQNVRLAVKLTGWRMDIHPDNPVERLLKPSDITKAEAKAAEKAQAEEAEQAAEVATQALLSAQSAELRPTAPTE